MNGSNLTFCKQFQPTVLEGQLCHTLKMGSAEGTSHIEGKRGGLLLALDPSNVPDSLVGYDEEEPPFKIYVHTLSYFTDHRAGTYTMKYLKYMKGTESFKAMPEKQKRCQVEDFEQCRTRVFLRGVMERCHCQPWTLTWNKSTKVNLDNNKKYSNLKCLFQEHPYCTPVDEACITQILSERGQCMVSCTGLYADIVHSDDSLVDEQKNLKRLITEGEHRMVYFFNT